MAVLPIDAVIPDSVPGSQKIIVAIGDIQANSKESSAHFLDIIEETDALSDRNIETENKEIGKGIVMPR